MTSITDPSSALAGAIPRAQAADTPAKDVFLSEKTADRDDDARDHRAPARDGNRVRPLVTAAEAYPLMEELILEAEERLHLSFRILDPFTPCVSDKATGAGFKDWGSLLVDAARRGVTVRLLLSDFDPIIAADLHRITWRSYHRVAELARDLDDAARGQLQFAASAHENEAGSLMRALFWPVVWRRLSGVATALKREGRHTLGRPPHELIRSIRKSENEDHALSLRELPGVWQVVNRLLKATPEEWSEQLEKSAEKGKLNRLRAPLWPPARLWPVTHHQKIMIADGRRAVLGGLDVNERRYDDTTHDRPAEEAWHDVSVGVEGPVIGDIERHFRTMWNADAPRAADVLDAIAPLLDVGPKLGRPEPFEAPETAPPDPIEGGGTSRAQFLRTLSVRRHGAMVFGPRSLRRDLEAAHHAVIEQASRVLYIETQFFRLRSLARTIAKQAEREPALKVIILLPNAPEDVAFDDAAGPDATHGEFLQVRALKLLKRKLGTRLGLYSLVQNGPREPDETGRALAYGAGIIYLHSKVMIADDRAALVSSANLNGRSFRWDTEGGLLWTGDGVRELRERLWNAHMPERRATLETGFDDWSAASVENAKATPEDRPGFVVPYQIGRARHFAARSLFVPDDMI